MVEQFYLFPAKIISTITVIELDDMIGTKNVFRRIFLMLKILNLHLLVSRINGSVSFLYEILMGSRCLYQ